jgi:hypothetical protein
MGDTAFPIRISSLLPPLAFKIAGTQERGNPHKNKEGVKCSVCQ